MNLDSFIPLRPAMPIVSRELFNSSRFVACVTRAGLIVQSHQTGTGKCMPFSHPQCKDYIEAIETAIDETEGNTLCKNLM